MNRSARSRRSTISGSATNRSNVPMEALKLCQNPLHDLNHLGLQLRCHGSMDDEIGFLPPNKNGKAVLLVACDNKQILARQAGDRLVGVPLLGPAMCLDETLRILNWGVTQRKHDLSLR